MRARCAQACCIEHGGVWWHVHDCWVHKEVLCADCAHGTERRKVPIAEGHNGQDASIPIAPCARKLSLVDRSLCHRLRRLAALCQEKLSPTSSVNQSINLYLYLRLSISICLPFLPSPPPPLPSPPPLLSGPLQRLQQLVDICAEAHQLVLSLLLHLLPARMQSIAMRMRWK